jgi:hypothetical protein
VQTTDLEKTRGPEGELEQLKKLGNKKTTDSFSKKKKETTDIIVKKLSLLEL